ncbi:hypothetical protein ABG957_10915 [Eggerthella lenta]|jgi:hypothetical protein|uniref:hypothetical protein n=1 Tax=Eggerthella lenta TaxID=84112 RepID=UPI001896FD3C|nr:hypothetical protein [Eggerthella lenta]MDB1806624.1 hypothetical protein [Eggerthella lenta]
MSKMTNLKKGVVGVCAATMLTGLCAVPAFAENAASATNGGTLSGGKGTTQVSIQSQNDQISATVPSAIKLVVGSDKNFVAPTDAKITNTGTLVSVKVSSVQVTTTNGSLVAEAAISSAAEDAAVLKVSKGGSSFVDAGSIDLSTATTDPLPLTDWTIEPGADLAVHFGGEVNKLSSLNAISLANVVWTIA